MSAPLFVFLKPAVPIYTVTLSWLTSTLTYAPCVQEKRERIKTHTTHLRFLQKFFDITVMKIRWITKLPKISTTENFTGHFVFQRKMGWVRIPFWNPKSSIHLVASFETSLASEVFCAEPDTSPFLPPQTGSGRLRCCLKLELLRTRL